MNNQLPSVREREGEGWGRGTICLWKFIAAHKSAVRARVMDMLSENWAALRGNDIDDSAQGREREREIPSERERGSQTKRHRKSIMIKAHYNCSARVTILLQTYWQGKATQRSGEIA